MYLRLITLFISIIFGSLILKGKPNCIENDKHLYATRIININDSVIFDLANATIGLGYIDIPVAIKSDDVINALDFSFKFDETKFMYDSVINHKSYLFALSNFNQVDRFLRFTSSSLQPINQNTALVSVRFNFVNSCTQIGASDFNSIAVYLNGDVCSYKISNAAQYLPIANFNSAPVCINNSTQFIDATIISGNAIASWSWNFGNSNVSSLQNPSTIYTGTGNYLVTLIVTSANGCVDTVSKLITVNDSPVSNFSYFFDCSKDSVFFTNISSISSGTISGWNWVLGDGNTSTLQNPIHNYASGGNFIVSLTSTSNLGCTHTFTDTILLNKPTADFGILGGCTGAAALFSDSSFYSSGTITGWQWYFGDGSTSSSQNPSHIYAASGTYTVSLVVSSSINCSDSTFQTINIDAKPIVKFGANILSGCLPLTVSFTDTSVTSVGSNYLWDFGDNTTSNLQHPSHTYLNSGSYKVKLIVTTLGGCTDSLVKNSYITIYNNPTANFSVSNGCSNIPVNFFDSSSVTGGTIVLWSWNFGDGNISSLQNPSDAYTNSGNYTITLICTTSQGCSDTISKSIIISGKPVVKFGANNLSGCSPHLVNFTDTSITASGSVYLWNFGDNTTSTLQNPAHTYLLSGTFSVKLIVTSPGGCVDSLVKNLYIYVYPKPNANFQSVSGCSGAILNFLDSSTIASGAITNWNWNFGNGNSSTQQNPLPIFTNAGTFIVTLVVATNQGCKDTVSKQITIDSKPIVKFGGDSLSGCAPLIVNFKDSSMTAINSSYYWNFGDTNTAYTMNASNTYLNTGVYTVKLIVTTPGGCVDSITKINYITVHTLPVAMYAALPDTASLPDATIQFTNLSTGYISSLWDFDDGNLSSLNNPSHAYSDTGYYNVCLNVTNMYGCKSMYCDTVYVINPNPIAIPSAFTPNGDNNNDLFRVRGGPFKEFEFKVFNEWGNLIFSSDKQIEGWDGSYKGEQQPLGLYEYIFKGKTNDEKNINMYGVVNLIR